MPVTDKQLQEKLQILSPTYLSIEDESGGCGAKFSVVIVSGLFEGVSPLERHRKVNECIKEELKEIHAITLKTWTPEQWEKKKPQTVQ